MLKISKLADYAVVTLVEMARQPDGQRATAAGLAASTKLPEPTVAKVLKLLGKAGIVTSTRGSLGGYGLSRDLASISVAEIIEAVDGPVSLTSCVDGRKDECFYQGSCGVRGRWDGVNTAMRSALQSVTLSDMGARTA